MPTTRRSRTIHAPAAAVWSVVGDPHHLPRWWPRVTRVERVGPTGFTMVLGTKKGKAIRADYRLRKGERKREHVWSQELEGSPFERVLRQAITEISVSDRDGEAEVRIAANQKLRGFSRFGGPLVRRATGRLLDQALDGLESACGR